MTVASASNRKTFAGDATTTSFATSPVEFFETSNLEVRVTVDSTGVETLLTEGTHYTVTGGDGATGTVNLAGGTSPHGAVASGSTLVILRVLPLTQATDFVQNDGSDAEVSEEALDRLAMTDSQLAEEVGRAVRFAAGDVSGSTTEIPDVTTRAGRLFGWDATGLLTTYAVQIGTAIVDLAASTGATLVGWIQAGTGAVLRTVSARLRDVMSVKDFGAVGDGTTDDRAALALAITAGTGRSLYFPSGTYKVSSNLTFDSTVGLIFENGAKLSPDVSVTITINGYTQSHPGASIFTGSGTIAVTNVASGITGLHNHFSGAYAGIANVQGAADEGTSNTAFGAQALRANTTGYGNTAVGANALLLVTTGRYNVAVGRNALAKMPGAGEQNVAVGMNALFNYTGVGNGGNVAVGTNALIANVSGTGNTAIGHNTLQTQTTATGCTAVGINAGNLNTATDLTAVGESAMFNNTGTSNTAVGAFAADANTSGSRNTVVGALALQANLTGASNTAIGVDALDANTGSNNTGVGDSALSALASGGNNSAIGQGAGTNLTSGNNNTILGSGAQPSAASVNNEVTVGDTSVATARVQVAWTVLSDERDKKIIGPVPGLAFVKEMHAFRHEWDRRDGVKRDGVFSGLSAQNLLALQQTYGEMGLVHSVNPERLEATYERVIPILVKAIQELTEKMEQLEKQQGKQ